MFAMGAAPQWNDWIYRALTFLVISCPCALVISIPLSFFAGIGGASHEGILVKGSNYLEALSKTKYVVFDKTGTITVGKPQVTDIITFGDTEANVLRVAAAMEASSEHPLAAAVLDEAKEKVIAGDVEVPEKP